MQRRCACSGVFNDNERQPHIMQADHGMLVPQRALSSGVKVGRAFSQPLGSLPLRMTSNSAASSGYFVLY